jgi:hypothetical protein
MVYTKSMRMLNPEYIVDAKGRKLKVVLAVEEYERLLAALPREESLEEEGKRVLQLHWRGALRELRDEYDSVGLQHQASRWRED